MSRRLPLVFLSSIFATGLIFAAGLIPAAGTGATALVQTTSAQATSAQATGAPTDAAAGASASAAANPTVGASGPAHPTSSFSPVASFNPEMPLRAKTLSASKAFSEPTMLYDFEGAGQAQWRVESDRVMGGRSTGSVEVAGGSLVFTGELVTEGGGFSSVRARRKMDLAGYDGIELRVRGGGRAFELDVDDGTESRGREVTRRGSFSTSSSWETVRVPFSSLEASAHGEPVSPGPIDLSAVRSIGFYIIDGQDGPFRLEVDWIRAYRGAE